MLETQAIYQVINRQPLVVSTDASIWQVIERLRGEHSASLGYVLVEKDGQLAGAFTEQDAIKTVNLNSDWQKIPIAEVMKVPALVLQESQLGDRFELIELFEQYQIDYLPIVDAQEHIVGTLSERDLLRLAASQVSSISSEKRARRSPPQNELQHTLTSDFIQVGIWDWQIESGVIYIDPLLKSLLGYEDQEIPNLIDEWTKYVHPEDLQKVIDAANSCLAGISSSYEVEHRMVHKDGSIVWFLARGQAIWDHDLKPVRMIGTDTNITNYKLAEEQIEFQTHILAHVSENIPTSQIIDTRFNDRLYSSLVAAQKNNQNQTIASEIEQKELVKQALAASEEKFRRIFEDAPIGISLVDLNTRYIQVNARLCQLLGYRASELQGKTLQDVTHPDDLEKELPYLERVILGEIDSYNLEQRYIRKDGSCWWANLIATVVRDDAGAILYTLGMVEDISDRKRSERALLQSEERFRKIFESGPLGMAIIGFNQTIIKVNTMLCEMLDYSEADLTRVTLRDITYPEDLKKDIGQDKQLYYGKISQYQQEKRYIRKNGTLIWVLINYSAIRDQNGKTINVLIALRDITKQREAQNYIQASLQEKEVLLKEIHHRVKNNLHVIANLLDLQAQNVEEEAIANLFIDSQNRIHAMALIHEQLYQSPAAGKVSFNEYVENLTQNLFQSYCFNVKQIEWRIEIEPVILNLETAIPCGLILNELVANSIKYAFPSCQSGQIYIRFRSIQVEEGNEGVIKDINNMPDLSRLSTENNSDRNFELVIGDNGVGITEGINWQSTTSMGLRLVRILGRQLEAKIELDRANGTQFRFTFGELKYKERFKSYDGSKSPSS